MHKTEPGECDRCDQVPASIFWSGAISHFLFASSSVVRLSMWFVFIPTNFFVSFVHFIILFASSCSVDLLPLAMVAAHRRWSCRRRQERKEEREEKKYRQRIHIQPENERFSFFPIFFFSSFIVTLLFGYLFRWCGILWEQRNENQSYLVSLGSRWFG